MNVEVRVLHHPALQNLRNLGSTVAVNHCKKCALRVSNDRDGRNRTTDQHKTKCGAILKIVKTVKAFREKLTPPPIIPYLNREIDQRFNLRRFNVIEIDDE